MKRLEIVTKEQRVKVKGSGKRRINVKKTEEKVRKRCGEEVKTFSFSV